ERAHRERHIAMAPVQEPKPAEHDSRAQQRKADRDRKLKYLEHLAHPAEDSLYADISTTLGVQMKWITRKNASVDRIACPWLVKRFIDPDAEFLYVPAAGVLGVAEREGAIPYD